MVKFFRHIRKSLLNEGNSTKYLKYAIGEILLVVIGILIAVQINNWNEGRLNKISETKLLKELLEDVKVDSIFFLARQDYLLQHLEQVKNLNSISSGNSTDSILNIPYNGNPIFDISVAYQSAVVTNNKEKIDQFSNDNIKELLRKYNLRHHYITLAYEQKDRYFERYANPLFLKYFDKSVTVGSTFTLLEYYTIIEFKKNKKLLNFVNGAVDNSLIRTNEFLKVNFELQKSIKAKL